MKCLYCIEKALFKCSCKGFYMCSVHLGTHFSATGSHPVENIDIELPESKLFMLRSNLIKRIKKINRAKDEISFKTKTLLKTIKRGYKEALVRLNEISKTYFNLIQQSMFCNSDLPIINDINLNGIEIMTINIDGVTNEISKIYSENFINHYENLAYSLNKFFEHHAGEHRCGAISQDYKLMVTGGIDAVIRVWDLDQKKQIFTLQGHNSQVRCLLLLNDSKHLITGSFDSTIRIWNLQNQNQIALLKGHTSAIRGLCYVESRSLIISGDKGGELITWDFNKHTIVKKLNLSDEIGCIALFESKSSLIAGLSKNIIFYDLETFKTKMIMKGHSDIVWCVHLTSNEKLMISGSKDASIIIWDLTKNKIKFQLKGHTSSINSLVLTSDEKIIISVSDDCTVRLWSMDTCNEISTFNNHSLFVTCILKFREFFFTLCYDSSIGILDLSKNELQINWFLRPAKFDFLNIVEDLNLVGYGSSNEAAIWDLNTDSDRNVLLGHKSEVQFVGISRDGLYAISGSRDSDENLFYWDLKSNRKLRSLKGHTNTVFCGDFSEDGLTAASGSADLTIRTWDLKNFTQICILQGHTDFISSIKFVSKKNLLVSGGGDKNVIIWNLKDNSQYAVLSGHNRFISRIFVTEKENYIVSCDDFEGIRIWDLDQKKQLFVLSHQEQAASWLKNNKLNPELVKEFLKV